MRQYIKKSFIAPNNDIKWWALHKGVKCVDDNAWAQKRACWCLWRFITVIKALCADTSFWGHNKLIEWFVCGSTNFSSKFYLKFERYKGVNNFSSLGSHWKLLISPLVNYFQCFREQENFWVLSQFSKMYFFKKQTLFFFNRSLTCKTYTKAEL